jgi:hypothetical protein
MQGSLSGSISYIIGRRIIAIDVNLGWALHSSLCDNHSLVLQVVGPGMTTLVEDLFAKTQYQAQAIGSLNLK